MTKEEAKIILQNCSGITSWIDEQGITWSYTIGDGFFEYSDSFGFDVHPYSSKQPYTLKYAYQFYVDKELKTVIISDSPMIEEEYDKLGIKI